ncbi:hypothetical protein OC25_07915 [Pedobacter kyungheensis]|uniref:RHS repeat-associated core domain-containing protein n=1 Tax=Pedobacter kyungheensis TaxID=1069985 RepID=A0A0C1G508_9SPHI|nr:RHS repeat-associated core domain-containing protein [Pedobacter kyungheensis]KIA95229.1 hypothetical protein OC25_07915 [Pedobacter kyungheensis]
MKEIKLLLLAFICVVNFNQLAAQDIHQTSTLVLPTSPATSYIVEPGKNVKISSSTAVVLGDGVHLKEGATVRVFIGNTPTVIPAPNNPALNLDMNWTSTKTYDEDGNVIAENKSFYDDRGTPLQSQVKSISTGHVLASQSLYDFQGRAVISTLAAPINNAGFSYRPDFVSNASGSKYNYTNFDGVKTNAPDPLGQGTIGSLGWYYSNNNTFEAYVPTTSFPYSRSAYYNDGSNSVKNSAGIGDELRMGKGHEISNASFPVLNELDFYSSVRAKYFSEAVIGNENSLKSKANQSFSIDQNGNIGMQVSDLSGKLLMYARADDNGVLTINNTAIIKNIEPEYKFTLTTASLIMGGNNPNAGGFGGGPNSFGVNSKYNVKIYRNGTLVFDGIGNEYVHPLTLNGGEYTIKSINPFTVSHNDGCSDCPGKIAESELSSIHYFQLFQAGNVSITGNYELYDMNTEGQVTAGFLPKGYYKVRALNGDVNISYTNKVSDVSFTFYNQLGQVVGNIAPEGVKLLLANGLNAYPKWENVPYSDVSEYNINGNLVAKTTVDGGRTEFIYRKDGQLRFSQNTEQLKTGRFSYTNFDRLSKPIESGEYYSANISFASVKDNDELIENISENGGLIGGVKKDQILIHYDISDQSHGLVDYSQDPTFLRTSVSWIENSNSKTWFNYNQFGKVKWIIKKINGLPAKTIDYTYNSKGNVETVDFQKNNPLERFIHYYEYDSDGRLENVYTSIDGATKLLQARYYYYLHGPVKRIELADELQGIDYTYTVDGMLKSINNPNAEADPGKDGIQNSFAPDVFAMTLDYYNGDYNRSGSGINNIALNSSKTWYSGNIAAQTWKSLKPSAVVSLYGNSINEPKMFTYEYNDRSQFSNNKFGAPNFSNNTFVEQINANREYGLNYDANGNIQNLVRTNQAGSQINFNYQYKINSNQLQKVDNYADYTYNDLGQMVAQQRINGQAFFVTYTSSGKVEAIYSDVNRTQKRLSFAYDEAGNRVVKTDHTQNITTYYIYDSSGNVLAVYDNNGSSQVQKEIMLYANSRIGVFNKVNQNYQYELTDNLGNVRELITRNKTVSGQADVIFSSDYYPFGSPLSLSAGNYRYGYQGQYAEIDNETGWNNFDFRMYDAQIGRWMSTDPYEEHHSPYLAMGNNPVTTVDPDGGCEKCPKHKPLQDGIKGVQLKDITIYGRKKVDNGSITTYKPNWAERWDNWNKDYQKFDTQGAFISKATYGLMNEFFIFASMLANGPNDVRDMRGFSLLEMHGAQGQVGAKAKALVNVLSTPAAFAEVGAAKAVNVPAGGVAFSKLETTAAHNLGFFVEEVAINNGVANVPITYMTSAKPSDLTIVFNALKTNGAKAIEVNSGPIINSGITERLLKAYETGNTFIGFKVTGTNNPDNLFILSKGLK